MKRLAIDHFSIWFNEKKRKPLAGLKKEKVEFTLVQFHLSQVVFLDELLK